MKIITILLLIVAILLLVFVVNSCMKSELTYDEAYKPYFKDSTFCLNNDDCVCGGFDTKNDVCFIGNIHFYDRYINKTRQCPDFCGGIGGNLATSCVNNKCQQINIAYCDNDTDCVRQSSCCDCGLGKYVNKKYYNAVRCENRCMCAEIESVGRCRNNLCVGLEVV